MTNSFIVYLFMLFINIGVIVHTSDDSLDTIVQQFKNRNQGTPNESDFFLYLSQLDNAQVNENVVNRLLTEVYTKQNPSISKNELLQIFEAKRTSIKDFRCNFDVHTEQFDQDGNIKNASFTSFRFVFCDNKYLLERNDRESDVTATRSYNGNEFISLNVPKISNKLPQAGIGQHKSMNIFFNLWSPFASSMLLDTVKLNSKQEYCDMVLFLKQTSAIICEKEEILDGKECLVVASLGKRFYLDPNRDFSVIKKEFYQFAFIKVNDLPVLKTRLLSGISKLYDFKDFGNSIWLPTKVENEYYDVKGKLTKRESVLSTQIAINSQIDESFFSNFIPNNAIVSDVPRGIIYKQSDSPSINSLLKETAKSKRIFIYRYISIISGFALIFIALAIKYRQYLKAKRERENRTEEIK